MDIKTKLKSLLADAALLYKRFPVALLFLLGGTISGIVMIKINENDIRTFVPLYTISL